MCHWFAFKDAYIAKTGDADNVFNAFGSCDTTSIRHQSPSSARIVLGKRAYAILGHETRAALLVEERVRKNQHRSMYYDREMLEKKIVEPIENMSVVAMHVNVGKQPALMMIQAVTECTLCHVQVLTDEKTVS